MNILRTFWKSARDLFEELFILGQGNILWVLINIPLIVALFLSLSVPLLFLVVLLVGVASFGPANAGLYAIAERVTEGRTSTWRHFIAGMREYARLSWKLYGMWMLGFVVILFNLQFYLTRSSTISTFMLVLFSYFAAIWLGFLIYIGPLMFLQTDKSIRTIARNAALMTVGRPLFTAITLLLMGLITVASYLVPILPLFITFAFLALWGFRATLTLIAEAEARREAADQPASQAVADKGRGGQVRPRK